MKKMLKQTGKNLLRNVLIVGVIALIGWVIHMYVVGYGPFEIRLDVVTLGSYEQDNDLTNGAEPIEWLVLQDDGEKTLLLTKNVLEYMPYNEDKAGDFTTRWDECSVRTWLNEDFYAGALTDEERAAIVEVTLENPIRSDFVDEPGVPTQEKVFLLDIDTAEETMRTARSRMAEPSAYAAAKGARINNKNHCNWWLRSFGQEDYAFYVDKRGKVCKRGFNIYYYEAVEVRPAMYVSNEFLQNLE